MMILQVLHLIVAKKILRYIIKTLDYRILYHKNLSTTLSSYVDMDWIKDLIDGQSIIDFIFKLGASPMTWISKK